MKGNILRKKKNSNKFLKISSYIVVFIILILLSLVIVPTYVKDLNINKYKKDITSLSDAIKLNCADSALVSPKTYNLDDLKEYGITSKYYTDGIIKVNNTCSVAYAIHDDNYCVTKTYDGESNITKYVQGNCTIFNKDTKYNYVAFGDSIAFGTDDNRDDTKGYNGLIKDYLEENKKSDGYVNYGIGGLWSEDLISLFVEEKSDRYKSMDHKNNDISNVKEDIEKSTVVTISIGSNDFAGHILNKYDSLSDKDIDKEIDNLMKNMTTILDRIKSYNENTHVIVVGIYNPYTKEKYPKYDDTKIKKIDEIIKELNTKYVSLLNEYGYDYVSLLDMFPDAIKYSPKHEEVHPSLDSYLKIANRIEEIILTY